MNELPKSCWSEWQIVEKIGSGSFGEVYKIRRVEDGKEYFDALKIIRIPEEERGILQIDGVDDSTYNKFIYSQGIVQSFNAYLSKSDIKDECVLRNIKGEIRKGFSFLYDCYREQQPLDHLLKGPLFLPFVFKDLRKCVIE